MEDYRICHSCVSEELQYFLGAVEAVGLREAEQHLRLRCVQWGVADLVAVADGNRHFDYNL